VRQPNDLPCECLASELLKSMCTCLVFFTIIWIISLIAAALVPNLVNLRIAPRPDRFDMGKARAIPRNPSKLVLFRFG
jgi:hypothetical protein